MHYTTSYNTQPSAPEDGQNNCSKHVELIWIINKSLLLHLVGCLYYLFCVQINKWFKVTFALESETDYRLRKFNDLVIFLSLSRWNPKFYEFKQVPKYLPNFYRILRHFSVTFNVV